MITDKTRELLTTYLQSIINTSNSKIGFGGNSSSPTQTGLDVPANIPVTTLVTKSDENVLEVKLSIDGSHLTGRVTREAGIFTSTPELLQRVNFQGVGPFSSSQTLEIFLLLEVE